jgi:hypothetical protein
MEVLKPKDPFALLSSFLSRIGTAVLGFLIALLLNSGLQKMHAIHQRHQLIDSLHEESQKDLVIMDGNYKFYDAYMHWADAMENQVDIASHKGAKGLPLLLPPDWNPADLLNPNNPADLSPVSSVFSGAKDGGQLSVLSTAENRLFARVYHQHDTMLIARTAFLATIAQRQEFECEFAPGTPPCAPYLSLMSKDDLVQYNKLLAKTELASYNMQMTLDHVSGAHTAVLNGAKTDDDVLVGIRDAMVKHGRVPTNPSAEFRVQHSKK